MALKLNNDAVRTQNKMKFSQQLFIILGVILVILVIIVINYVTSAPMRDVVEVAVLTNNTAQNAYISENMLDKQTMVRADYEQAAIVTMSDGSKRRTIVLFEDIKDIVGKYAANYIRKGTPIYYDEVTKEYTKSNSYLYQMDGTELLKVDVDPKQFGNILVPGDKLNIRITYDEQKYNIVNRTDYLQLSEDEKAGLSTVETKTELMFSEVTVLDMLNSEGESIFDKYYALMSLPESQQRTKFLDKTFQQEIQPKCVLLAVTPEEAERYTLLGGKTKGSLITLMPRISSNPILEAINSLTNGVTR